MTVRAQDYSLSKWSLFFSITEISVMIFVMILNHFTAGSLLVCSWASKMWTWLLSSCQYLLLLFWSRRVCSRLSTAGERKGNMERFSFTFRLRAFPRLASSGQHKPVLWAGSQARSSQTRLRRRHDILQLSKEGVDYSGKLRSLYCVSGYNTQPEVLPQWIIIAKETQSQAARIFLNTGTVLERIPDEL